MTEFASIPPVTRPTITLVEGACFVISATSGEILPGGDGGLYYQDTRVISSYRLLLDGLPPEPLSLQPETPYAATFVAQRRSEGARMLVERRRLVGNGMREDVVLRNLGREDTSCRITVEVEADFADLFSVKEGHPKVLGDVVWSDRPGEVYAEASATAMQRGLRLRLDGAHAVAPGQIAVDVVVPAGGRWHGTVQATPVVDGNEPPPAYPTGQPVRHAEPATRFREWRESSPTVRTPAADIAGVLDESVQDLGALRFQTAGPDNTTVEVVAAGAPWFMTLFGRDSLLTSWMAIPIDPGLAVATLGELARLQGQQVDPLNEEEPGRILHEVRHGTSFPLTPGHSVYYGSVDATPLFCMLVGELYRWGASLADLEPLMPAVDNAMRWITEYGDRDGDGFVEYQRATDKGLFNQGWKDSWDSVAFSDGRIAEPPIALAEVQAYVYGALRARAMLAAELEDAGAAEEWNQRARELKTRFHNEFWLPDKGYLALALDGDKTPVDALASNMGHCLWTGLVEPDVAHRVAAHLTSPQLFSGWGVRTLATSMARFDPMSYHNGSVWPHDNALCAAGLARYGHIKEASQIARGIFDAAARFGGRLPEVFCGFEREEFRSPVPYPTSCSPQAWAAAAPFLLLRALVGFEPDAPRGVVRLNPELADGFAPMHIDNLPFAGRRISIAASEHAASVEGLDTFTVRTESLFAHSHPRR